MASAPTGRILALESVRGIAAFAVVISHLVMAFADPYPTGRPAEIETIPAAVRVPLELAYRPIRDGQFAVMIFFVLSGVVLSQGYLHRGKFSDLTAGIVRRYPRLAIPALISALVSCALWQMGMMFNADASHLLIESGIPANWLQLFRQDAPSFCDAIYQSTVEIFFARDTPAPPTMYNAVLWTMRTEFYGSLLVFALLGLVGKSQRVGFYTFLVFLFLALIGQTRLALFPAGMVLAVLRRDRPNAVIPAIISVGMLLMAYILCGCYELGEFKPKPMWPGGNEYYIVEVVCGFAGILSVAVVLFSPPITRFLEWWPFVWLGKVSFGLYLVHLPIVLSLGSFVFASTFHHYGHGVAMMLSAIAVIATSLPSAWLMFHLADRPAVWVGKQVSRLLVRPSNT